MCVSSVDFEGLKVNHVDSYDKFELSFFCSLFFWGGGGAHEFSVYYLKTQFCLLKEYFFQYLFVLFPVVISFNFFFFIF